MAFASRVSLRELTPGRISAAVLRRVADVPHLLAWHSGNADTRALRARILPFRGCHAGERCVVIGNGPSLARMDLSPLRDCVTFGTNRIYLLFEKLAFRPTYFVCVNELVLEQFTEDIRQLPMPKFLNWNRRALWEPADSRTCYVRTALGFKDYFAHDASRTLASGGTVTYVALQLAYYMGFRDVVLVGVDHRFAESGTPNRAVLRAAARDESHFHPDYFPKGSRWQLPDLRRSELAYRLARHAFEAAGGRVIDATLDGSCRVFEKAPFDSLFS